MGSLLSPKLSGKRAARSSGRRRPGGAAFGLGADGIEIDEPAAEQRPRHRLQRLRPPPVQLDLVVQRSEEVGDSSLFLDLRKADTHRSELTQIESWDRTSDGLVPNPILQLRARKQIIEE